MEQFIFNRLLGAKKVIGQIYFPKKIIKKSKPKKTSNSKNLKSPNRDNINNVQNVNYYVAGLFENRVKWGGFIRYRNKNNVELINTCTIDNLLLAIYILSKLQNNFLQKIPQIHQTNLLLELILQ